MALGSTGPIEAKVSWPSLAATVLTGLVFAANHTDLIPGYDGAPTWVKAIVSVLVIAGGTFGVGVAAPHTFRTDPDAVKTGRNRAAVVEHEPPSNVHRVGDKGYRLDTPVSVADLPAPDGPAPGADERLHPRRDLPS